MANGFFLGGVAQGIGDAKKLDVLQQEADAKTSEQETKRAALQDAKTRLVQDQGDKLISATMSNIGEVLKATAQNGGDVNAIMNNSAVQSLLSSAQGIARRIGRDPEELTNQIKIMALTPATPQKEKGPQTDIGKIHADVANGHITPQEGAARIGNITRPLGEANVVEGIRRKLSAGEALTPGETRVYDDALKADPIARLLAGALGGRATPPAVPGQAPAATAPAASAPDPLGVRR